MLKENKRKYDQKNVKENTTRNKAYINQLIFSFTKGAHTFNRKNKRFAVGLEL